MFNSVFALVELASYASRREVNLTPDAMAQELPFNIFQELTVYQFCTASRSIHGLPCTSTARKSNPSLPSAYTRRRNTSERMNVT